MTRLEPAADAAPADWIFTGLPGFAESVLSLVPAGFPAYVRMFHPAYKLAGGRDVAVRWSEIATASGACTHPAMQLSALTGVADHLKPEAGVFDSPPDVAGLPAELEEPLVAALRLHTATPDRCWFAIWEGYGGLGHDVLRAPTFDVPHRSYHLLTGPIECIVEGLEESPNLWWPDDHTWCVASEVDLNTTYIGCTVACRDEILARPELEALPMDPASGITFDSDLVNPPPSK